MSLLSDRSPRAVLRGPCIPAASRRLATFACCAALGLTLALAGADARAATPPKPAPAPAAGKNASCPPQLDLQYQKLAAYPPDGAAGSVDGFQPRFDPRTPARLIHAQLGAAHGGSGNPTELLPPDELNFTPGRPARWTLWNGGSPEPAEEIFVLCDYEGGMRLQFSVGTRIRGCTLATAGQRPSPQAPTTRTLLTRAVFSCR